jgi:alpha-beta hydrolase superfamily lysophospholipase/SAM-dependent methyltransferase
MTLLEATPERTTAAAPALSAPPAPSEHNFTTWDGTALFYQAWLPAGPATKALFLFHRGHEHSGRFEETVRELDLPQDTAVFAWDARGHGRSPGDRGYADSFADVVKDADAFVRHACRVHGIALEDVVVLGHSVAAVLVAAWVHDYAPPVRAMVLATPAFDVRLYVPLALPALRLRMAALGGKAYVKSYVKAGMITRDLLEAERYANDPLISRQIAVNILIDLHDTAGRLIDDAGAIRVPTLVLTAGTDWVVNNRASRRFFERLTSPVKELEHFDGFRHAIFHDTDRHRPIGRVKRFVEESFARPASRPSLLTADREGYTKAEFDRLMKRPPAYCPRRLAFAGQRVFMKTLGRLSDGMAIGWRHGFDSGQSLDHVYRNRAAGRTPLGRLIDRVYLDTIGWRGIRQRRANLERAIVEAAERLGGSGEPVCVVDVAAGPGRYLLETLKRLPHVSAVLRDRSPTCLAEGRKLAAELGLTSVTFAEGDAFDFDSLAALAQRHRRPNVAVVSGLYELFPGNEKVLTSLRGLAAALPAGGYLVYTNQPWHPQVEMIARTLDNRDGVPWVMRRRTQEEMDELVGMAGFEKLEMAIDRFGIFTVSLARRKMGRE